MKQRRLKKPYRIIALIVVVCALIATGTFYYLNRGVPKELLTVSEKKYSIGENIQTSQKLKRKYYVFNRPETENQYIIDIFDQIEESTLALDTVEKSAVIDWNAILTQKRYLNIYTTLNIDSQAQDTKSYVYDLETDAAFDPETLFTSSALQKHKISNDGSLQLLDGKISQNGTEYDAAALPDLLKSDYGDIKPTPPPAPKPNQPISSGSGKKIVAFTFDDGPSKDYTYQVMDIAEQYNSKVTFFQLGSQIAKFPEVSKAVVDRGHQIASHTYSHRNLTEISADDQKYEINSTEDLIRKTTGYQREIMVRPPYGAKNDALLSNIPKVYMNWSVDTLDWKSRNADAVCQRIVEDAHEGAVILMHDIYPSTVEGFKCGIEKLSQQGYTFVTVDELFKEFGRPVEKGNIYTRP